MVAGTLTAKRFAFGKAHIFSSRRLVFLHGWWLHGEKGNAGRIKRFGRRSKGGGDLLSHFRSTIGAVRFNFSVRNGKRWSPHAIAALVSLSPDIPGVMGEKERIGKSTPNFLSLPFSQSGGLCSYCIALFLSKKGFG